MKYVTITNFCTNCAVNHVQKKTQFKADASFTQAFWLVQSEFFSLCLVN